MVACMSGAVSRAYLERSQNNSPWIRPQTEDSLPFFVEFRHSHPFLAEYDKRIVFNSGKAIGLWPGTGGAGPFAVYDLASGEISSPVENSLDGEKLVGTVNLYSAGSWRPFCGPLGWRWHLDDVSEAIEVDLCPQYLQT